MKPSFINGNRKSFIFIGGCFLLLTLCQCNKQVESKQVGQGKHSSSVAPPDNSSSEIRNVCVGDPGSLSEANAHDK
jgi:hypothetical protein